MNMEMEATYDRNTLFAFVRTGVIFDDDSCKSYSLL